MRIKSIHLSLSLILSLGLSTSFAQSSQDASVELSATVQADPPRIILSWKSNPNANQYFIYRKLKTASSWGSQLDAVPGTENTWIDSTVTRGVSYEYRVSRSGANFNGYGYINSGIEIPLVESRGILILVIDDTFSETLRTEIGRLIADFEGDGWMVERLDVSRDSSTAYVKARIKSTYSKSPGRTRALCLLGHVPVPYSGDLYPDSHPDHEGAWPADVYYADINGTWTDAAVNVVVASDPRHRNTPGDGKFDQSAIPTDVELQTGRIDFANMPAFALPEEELLRNYLNKDHAYKNKQISARYRGLIDDNFGYFSGEAFAASGWKNIATLVGQMNVSAGDYFPDMADSSYLWSYGCGGGWYQGANGIGSTGNFASSSTQSIFTILFGSYFGDWDSQDNFLRAPLAQGLTLTNVWSGRPHWQFHHMGLGENIGYSARISQNNNGTYFANNSSRGVHIALMGDPTLRNDIVAPVSDLVASILGQGTEITWRPSPDDVAGYHIYYRSDANPEYKRLNDTLVRQTSFTHSCLFDQGIVTYMVRAVNLQASASGTYYNMSQGITDTVMNNNTLSVEANAGWSINGNEITFSNFSFNATSFTWDFGDGNSSVEVNPVHAYPDGLFFVTLIATNGCVADTFTFEVTILTALTPVQDDPSWQISPNPSTGKVQLRGTENHEGEIRFTIYSAEGKKIMEQSGIHESGEIDLAHVPDGLYVMILYKENNSSVKKFVISRE